MKRHLHTLLVCLFLLVGATSLFAEAVTIPTADGTVIDISGAEVSGLKVESKTNIGSTGKDKWMKLAIKNSVLQDYVLQFYSGAKGCSGTWSLTIESNGGANAWETTTVVPQSSTANWNLVTLHRFLIPQLPAGEYTFKLLCTAQTGSYAGNIGNFGFYTTDNVETLPCTLNLNNGVYTGARVESAGNVGYVSNGTSATYGFYCPADGYYNLSMGVTYYGDGDISIKITNSGTQEVETTSTFTVTSDMTNYSPQTLLSAVRLTKGFHNLNLAFSTSASYLLNYKDLVFTEASVAASDVESITVDGVALDNSIITDINSVSKSFTATLAGYTFTSMPAVKATLEDGSVISGELTVSGSTGVCSFTSGAGESKRTYTLNIQGLHLYEKTALDKTHSIAPSTGTTTGDVWSDGEVTLNGSGDWAFKLRSGSYTLTTPSNWKIKQIVFRGSADNYASTGYVSAAESEGATVYLPFVKTFIKGEEKNLTFNIEDYTLGKPFCFTLTDVSQATIRYIDIVYEEVAISEAPKVVSTSVTPTEGKNHAVIAVTFDHAVAEAQASCGGTAIKPRGLNTTTLYFSCWDLDYNQDYTLTIPAGSAKDAYGNATTEDITVSFTTGAKQTVSLSKADYTVSTVADLRAAVAAANATTDKTIIFVKNGDYDLSTTALELTGKNIYIIGESRDGVLLHGLRDGISNPVVDTRGSEDTYLENLTIRSDYDWRAAAFKGVSVALRGGKRSVCYHVTLESNQDTYVTWESGYLLECDIHGTVDFICGGGDYFFDRCNIILENRGGNCITAPNTNESNEWGYVFSNCTVKRADGATAVTDKGFNLGRPWQNAPRCNFLNTVFEVLPSDAGWASMADGLYTYFYEYGSKDKNGSALNLSTRSVEACKSANGNYTPLLSAEDAAEYTVNNVLGGNDSWSPLDMFRTVEEVTVAAKGLATFSSSHAVTIPEGIEAYYISEVDEAEGKASVKKITTGSILANYGVILRNTADEAVECSFAITDEAVSAPANLLEAAGCQGAAVAAGDFILAKKSGNTGFYPLSASGTLGAHKAFLPKAKAAKAAAIVLLFDDETSSISSLPSGSSQSSDNVRVNLAGQRVGDSFKGIVIKNGKKIY